MCSNHTGHVAAPDGGLLSALQRSIEAPILNNGTSSVKNAEKEATKGQVRAGPDSQAL